MNGVVLFISKLLELIYALVIGSLIAYVLASIINTQFVLAPYDVPISFADRFNMTMFDISNMVLYLAVIAVAFIIGFSIAAVLKRFIPKLASIAYPIAGAAAIGVTLGLMYIFFQTIPISGARSIAGYLGQVFAGAIGGFVFGKILYSRAKSEPKMSK